MLDLYIAMIISHDGHRWYSIIHQELFPHLHSDLIFICKQKICGEQVITLLQQVGLIDVPASLALGDVQLDPEALYVTGFNDANKLTDQESIKNLLVRRSIGHGSIVRLHADLHCEVSFTGCCLPCHCRRHKHRLTQQPLRAMESPKPCRAARRPLVTEMHNTE